MPNDRVMVEIAGDPSGAVRAFVSVKDTAQDFGREMQQVTDRLTAQIAGVVTGVVSIRTAIAGIRNADELRDLSLSLGVITGSAKAGGEAMAYFEQAANKTRTTGDALATTFRNIFPTASERGFSRESIQQITVALSQLSMVSGKSADQLNAGFQQLLSGSANTKNELLRTLGFTKADIDGLNWSEVIQRMEEVSSHADEFGQSFDSTMEKIQDAWQDAFGEGFNDAMSDGRKSFDGIRDVLTDPQFLSAIADVGGEVGKIVIAMRDLTVAYRELKREHKGGASSNPNGYIQKVTDWWVGGGDQEFYDQGGRGSNLTDLTRSHQSAYNGNPLFRALWGGDQFSAPAETSSKELASSVKDLNKEIGGPGGLIDNTKKAKKALEDMVLPVKDFGAFYGWGALAPGQAHEWTNAGSLAFRGAGNLSNAEWMTADAAGNVRSARERGEAEGLAHAKAFEDALRNDRFIDDFASAFGAVIQTGGRDFVGVLAAGMGPVIQQSANDFTAMIFGEHDTSIDPSGTKLYGPVRADGTRQDITGRARGMRTAMLGLEIGAGGYEAGYSGAPGARSASTLGGAMAGASMGATYGAAVFNVAGAVIGAVLGAVVGAAGGAIGAAQRQSEYQYGIPNIDARGRASLGSTRNLVPARVKEIEQQIQAEYNLIHDSLINLIVKFPDVAIPSVEAINGKFQDNPSAHWGEHLQQWITGTLPRQLMGALGDELAKGFGQLGMSETSFKGIFAGLENIDPSKAVALLGVLADGLKDINEASIAFHRSSYANKGYLAGQNARTPGEVLSEMDDEMIKLAQSISSLSPQGQIEAISRLGQMEQERYRNLMQFEQDLLNTSKALRESFKSAQDQLAIEGMVNADGSQNYAQQAYFFRKRADTDLLEIGKATTAADVQAWTQKYIQDILESQRLGGLADPKNAGQWRDWAQTNLQIGQAASEAALKRLGESIDKVNATFNQQIDPALAAFTGNVNTATGALTKIIDPVDRLGKQADTTASNIAALNAAVVDLTARMRAMGESDSGFAARQAASRVAYA